MREDDFDDVTSAVDDGGGVAILHDAGAIRRNVKARELAIFTGGSDMRIVAELARDMETNGDRPCVKFHRDPDGEVDGIVLCVEAA